MNALVYRYETQPSAPWADGT